MPPASNQKSAKLAYVEESEFALAGKAEREHLWRSENAEAIVEMNHYVDRNGLPLARYRLF